LRVIDRCRAHFGAERGSCHGCQNEGDKEPDAGGSAIPAMLIAAFDRRCPAAPLAADSDPDHF
jgi:hypothetical protein